MLSNILILKFLKGDGMKKILVMGALALALVASPAMAKEGLYLGGGLVINSITGDDLDMYDAGGGLNLRFGYNFGQVALEADLMGSGHTADGYEDASFGGFSINLRVYFSPDENPTQPYFLAGIGGYGFEFDNGDEFSGGGFNLGFGLEHYLNTNLALDFQAVYRFIEYDEFNGYPIAPEYDGDVFTLAFGLNYHF
jgi:opacity protein-like surface antigen